MSYCYIHVAWKWLAFQGCWRDQTSNRDLPAEVPGITTPALCIEACTGMEYDYAGVQLVRINHRTLNYASYCQTITLLQ